MNKPTAAADSCDRPEDQLLAEALAQHHRGLDRVFAAIVAQAGAGDSAALRSAWESFELELLRHIELEDRWLLPPFERDHAAEGRALRAEHDDIRDRLFDLGIALDLHELRAGIVADFVTCLRAHADREDHGLYPWAERHLPPETWLTLDRDLARTDAHGSAIVWS